MRSTSPRDERFLLPVLLDTAAALSRQFLDGITDRPVQPGAVPLPAVALPETGEGTQAVLERLRDDVLPLLTASAGPRYLGFVTGGGTPAALAADWITSAVDNNASDASSSAVVQLEEQAIAMLCDLLSLPTTMAGWFVSGATMANMAGLATARQWLGEARGVDVAADGAGVLPDLRILSATPHASVVKAAAILGIGRNHVRIVDTVPGTERVHVPAMATALAASDVPTIIVANAGTVTTTAFDDIAALAALAREHRAWLHVDGAFGLFATLLPAHAAQLAGLADADSICGDAHKWLNVPYDSGFVLTRHPAVQARVFRNAASYFMQAGALADPFHHTPENSRRWRALAVWATLLAYGRSGVADVVAECCACAASLGAWIEAHPDLELLAPVSLNVVAFRLGDRIVAGRDGAALTRVFLDGVAASGDTFLTPATLSGRPGVRAAFSNWRTTAGDDLPRIQRGISAGVAGVSSGI
ncbi:MAG: aspartate aminotransferase family protein [Gemmatimonadaceae bacterium]|nr:aspartate aminotransferase family protein [Gemmatimonadaceae bacterium]